MRTGLFLVSVLATAGCHFDIPGVDWDAFVGGRNDVTDLRVPTADLSPLDDLYRSPDLSLPFVPSHVDPSQVPAETGALAGVSRIDTSGLMLTLAGGATLPSGISFARDSHGWAVLSVGSWLVDGDVQVVGSAPLVVISAGEVNILRTISAAASLDTPGPGGSPPEMGDGAGKRGTDGTGLNGDDSGGGGAAFGTDGAAGGDTTGFTPLTGGAAGMMYGGTVVTFEGGSGGGNGGHFTSCSNSLGLGGAGGGAIQISSATSITINGGAIEAGGGGGRGGCNSQASAGAGGGSGGTIFLEAPMVALLGNLMANGGGGGGGGQYLISDGGNGGNGGDTLAAGGTGSSANIAGGGGAGGNGYLDPSFAMLGGKATNAGGGGGGGGRIWLRTRGAKADVSKSKVSPPAGFLTDF